MAHNEARTEVGMREVGSKNKTNKQKRDVCLHATRLLVFLLMPTLINQSLGNTEKDVRFGGKD